MSIFTRPPTPGSTQLPAPADKISPTTYSFSSYSKLYNGLIAIKQGHDFPAKLILMTPYQRYDISIQKTIIRDPDHARKFLNQYKVTDISQTNKLIHANPFTLIKALWWKITHCFSSDRTSEITTMIETPIRPVKLTPEKTTSN